jgi:predicted N-acetyltransferase YhbS
MPQMSMLDRNQLTFRSDSLADPATRVAWVALLRDIFGLDFGEFSRLNIWPQDYRAFSYLEGAVIAANVSCNPLPLRLAGRPVLAGQLQGVATRPPYRRRGLFQDLMNHVLAFADASYECLLLYTGTPDLYRRFGFRLLEEQGFAGRLTVGKAGGSALSIRSLSARDPRDIELIRRLFTARTPISDHLGVVDNEGVFFSNLLLQPGFRLSYLASSDALVVWDRDGIDGRARLLDIVSPRMPAMHDLAAVLGLAHPDEEIDILFPPDRLLGDVVATAFRHPDGDQLMVRGPFEIEHKPFMLPLTAVS